MVNEAAVLRGSFVGFRGWLLKKPMEEWIDGWVEVYGKIVNETQHTWLLF